MARFTVHERRILGLPIKGAIRGKDAAALRKIIDTFPFILGVADSKFNPIIAEMFVLEEGTRVAMNRLRAELDKEDKSR